MWKAILSFVGSAAWWFIDRLWGDPIFDWFRPMIPSSVSNPSLEAIITFGPIALALLLAAYFFYKQIYQPKKIEDEAMRNEDRSVNLGKGASNSGQINTGDITINPKLDPKALVASVSDWKADDIHGFRKEYLIEMTNPAEMDGVQILVVGDKISGLEPIPKRSGMMQTGHSGVRDNLHFTEVVSLNNFSGFYVYASEPEDIEARLEVIR